MIISRFKVKENGERISKEEWNSAVDYLIQKCPKKSFAEVEKLIEKEGKDICIELHFGFGMYIRNTLREGGFGWGAHILDDNWVELFTDASKKFRKTSRNNH